MLGRRRNTKRTFVRRNVTLASARFAQSSRKSPSRYTAPAWPFQSPRLAFEISSLGEERNFDVRAVAAPSRFPHDNESNGLRIIAPEVRRFTCRDRRRRTEKRLERSPQGIFPLPLRLSLSRARGSDINSVLPSAKPPVATMTRANFLRKIYELLPGERRLITANQRTFVSVHVPEKGCREQHDSSKTGPESFTILSIFYLYLGRLFYV